MPKVAIKKAAKPSRAIQLGLFQNAEKMQLCLHKSQKKYEPFKASAKTNPKQRATQDPMADRALQVSLVEVAKPFDGVAERGGDIVIHAASR